MKKLATLFTLLAGASLSFGQAIVHNPGSVQFLNTELNHTVGNNSYHIITNSQTSVGLVGTQYKAELYYFDTTLGSLQPLAATITSMRDTTATGSSRGTWNGPTVLLPAGYGGVDVDTTIGGTEAGQDAPGFTSPNGDGLYPVQLEVFVWDSTTGATYETAGPTKNHSALFSYTQRASSSPPAVTDSQMVAQPGFIVPVPEPSAIALSIMGVAGLLFIRRRKN